MSNNYGNICCNGEKRTVSDYLDNGCGPDTSLPTPIPLRTVDSYSEDEYGSSKYWYNPYKPTSTSSVNSSYLR